MKLTSRDQIYATIANFEPRDAILDEKSILQRIPIRPEAAEESWIMQPGEAVEAAQRQILAIATDCVNEIEAEGVVWRGDVEVRLSKPASIEEVFSAIDGEREYQDSLGSDRTSAPHKTHTFTQGESFVLIRRYHRVSRACGLGSTIAYNRSDNFRKIAGICVQILEKYGIPDVDFRSEIDSV